MNEQRKKPALRFQTGLAGSPLARVNSSLAKRLGRPPSGNAQSSKDRKAKSRLRRGLKPAAYAAINKLLGERYRKEPNLLIEERTKMIEALLNHPEAEKIIAAINDNPDNLDIYMKEADQGKGLLISIAGKTIDTYDYGQTAVFSQSEVIDERQQRGFFAPDGSETNSGPGGKPPKTIRTKWNWGKKYEAERKECIREFKIERIRQAVLAALDCKFTPIEIELEPAITDGDEIIQAAKMGMAHRCSVCNETVTDKWEHLEGKHNWLVRKESTKVRKHFRDSLTKSPTVIT